MNRFLLLASVVVLIGGCKDPERNFFTSPDLTGVEAADLTSSGSMQDMTSTGQDGPSLQQDLAGQVDPKGPTITIISPLPTAEVQYATLEVTAMIVGDSGTAIDPGSVVLSVPSAQMGQADHAAMSLTAMPGVYQGRISIGHIPSGPSEFSVAASDILHRPNVVTAGYLHDGGPVITFLQPTAKTAKGSVNVELLVDDKLHPITNPAKVRIGVRALGDITLTVVAGAVPLRLTGVIDFSDYSPPLDGEQLIAAEATNEKGTIGRGQQGFIVDNVGPSIEIVTPIAGQFIGGIVEVKAKISDISDVIDTDVVAIFANDPTFSVALRRNLTADEFVGQFDVRQLGKQIVLPTMSVRAQDKLGNESEVAEVIVVDNEPPGLSLDPPKLRLAKVSAFTRYCSINFDPLGSGVFDPPNDGAIVKQVFSVRARAEDRGNHAPGLALERPSLIRDNSVDLFAIGAGSAPLVVDTDGDGKCDSINPLLVPTTMVSGPGQALSVRMQQITSQGVADFINSINETLVPGCDVMGEAGAVVPGPLCPDANTYMTVGLFYTSARIPSLWTIPPVAATTDSCVGFQLDTLNKLAEGPTCLAIRAHDVAGNPGVSMPMRVCIDRRTNLSDPDPCPGFDVGTAPNCTGTYNPTTNTVSSTACTDAQPFPASGEVVIQ